MVRLGPEVLEVRASPAVLEFQPVRQDPGARAPRQPDEDLRRRIRPRVRPRS